MPIAMLISEKSEFICFEYKARKPYFNRILIEWKGIVLNPSTTDSAVLIDLSHDNLTELFFDIYGSLCFLEIAELFEALQGRSTLKESMNWDLYFNKQNLVWNTRSEQIIKQILKTNEAFKSWAYDRKLSSADLMPLNALTEFRVFNSLSYLFTDQRLTRSDGKRVIDLLVDLILMDRSVEALIPEEGQNWLEHLVKLRFPMTLEKDNSSLKSNELGELPKFMNLTQFRQGDRLMSKLQITFTDTQDLRQKLNRLELTSRNQ